MPSSRVGKWRANNWPRSRASRVWSTGHDPLHAAYLHGQNYLSVFGELASRLSEFETYRAVVARAEETYVPGWPPMSPVSVSFFTSWALLDLLLGETNDTICSCALEVGKVFGMSDELALTLEVMEESAMGIYEHLGGHDGVVGLDSERSGAELHGPIGLRRLPQYEWRKDDNLRRAVHLDRHHSDPAGAVRGSAHCAGSKRFR